MATTHGAKPAYVLGHDSDELDRLDAQAENLRPFSARLLRDAGITSGMRVLDAGCGMGDLALLAADLVGPAGAVVGVDRSADTLRIARLRAASRGWQQVRFVEHELATFIADEPFDAIVGRQVLIHQPDPTDILRHLSSLLRFGGVIAWSEEVLLPNLISPARPLYSRCVRWLEQTLTRAGMRPNIGLSLHTIFVEAGLPAPHLRLDGAITAGADDLHYRWLGGTVRTLLPLMERLAITTAQEAQPGTLESRLIAEAIASGGTACGFGLVSAWIRKA